MKLNMLLTGCLLAALAAPVGMAAEGSATAPAATRATATRPTTTTAAAETLESTPLAGRKAGDWRGALSDWIQPLAALAAVVVLIFVLRAVLKRLTGRGTVAAGGAVAQVLYRAHLGGRCEVCLVRLGRRLLLVGLGASGPVTLCEIRDEQEVDALLAALAGAGGHAADSGAIRDVTEKIRSRLAGDSKAQD